MTHFPKSTGRSKGFSASKPSTVAWLKVDCNFCAFLRASLLTDFCGLAEGGAVTLDFPLEGLLGMTAALLCLTWLYQVKPQCMIT